MLTAKKFTVTLSAIRKSDEAFRSLVSQALAFAIFHGRNHGQKTPFLELTEAVPGWLKKDLGKVKVDKSKKPVTDTAAHEEADFLVATWFASQEEKKALRSALRAAGKKDSPDVESTPEALVLHGSTIVLTEDEAAALAGYLTMIRASSLIEGEAVLIDGEAALIDV